MGKIRFGYQDRSFSEVRRYPGNAGHMVTIAPTGSGKGRDVLIPALLDESLKDTSCLVVDPKGQLAAVTGPQQARMGKHVIIMNPFNIWPEFIGPGAAEFRGLEELCQLTAGYNPMLTLNPASNDFVPDVEALAHAMIFQEGGEGRDSHWYDSARELVSGLIMYAVAISGHADQKNLGWVRRTLCKRDHLFAYSAEFHGKDDLAEVNDFIQQKLGRFGEPEAHKKDEISSIISTAITQTGFIGNTAISNSLCNSSFLFQTLRDRPTTLYLILPGRRLKTCVRWFRLIVGSALNELMNERRDRGCTVLFMLDEFAQLGRLRTIEDAFGIARDYKLLLWPVVQDLNQLKRDYPDAWETMLANAGMVQFFRPKDNTTAEYVSQRMPDIHVERPTRNISVNLNRPDDVNISTGIAVEKKKYLDPWEIREIGNDEFLLFADGKNGVLRGARRSYLETPEFRDRNGTPKYSPDPYHL